MHKQALKLVFSNPIYIILSVSIFVLMLVALLQARELLFFEPYFVFHLPEPDILSFILINIVSGLMGLVISLTIFRVISLKAGSKKIGTGVFGSIVGAGAGVCSTCGPLGFAIISTFGVAGAASLSFLTIYEVPIRLIAIGILSATYFLMVKGITSECKIETKTSLDET